jgi:hypothetical protein
MGGYPMSLASSTSNESTSTYPPTSPAFAIHSSNANTHAPGSNPAYRRPNPQHLPPGAQTPDVNLSFQNFSPLENAVIPPHHQGHGQQYPISQPNSVPNSASHSASSSFSRSTTPIPQVSTTRVTYPIEEGQEGGGGGGGITSGMLDRNQVPGSPDPKRRTGVSSGGANTPKWS